tara:strand:+ start:40 stop:624 length:585 start_codon:yes stop_codon:yes gene_type:complete
MNKKKDKRKRKAILLSGFLLGINILTIPTYAATEINLVSGLVSRKISINAIEKFTNNQAEGVLLKGMEKLKKEDLMNLSKTLKQEYKMNLVITSKLMNSKIGEAILKRLSKIVYPYRLPNSMIRIPAIRSAVIKSLYKEKETISIISFLKYYPNKIITINVQSLFKIIEKIESISDLVKFFSDSPLEGLKKVYE